MPGCFISLDGLDGTGKSTQCRLLAEWLRSLGEGTVPVTLGDGGSEGEAETAFGLGNLGGTGTEE